VIKLGVAAQDGLVVSRLVCLIQAHQHAGLQPGELKGIGKRPLHRAAAFLPGYRIAVSGQPIVTGRR
jgi:hypothetical protein